jgi:exopolysaccharide production protein ExoQ
MAFVRRASWQYWAAGYVIFMALGIFDIIDRTVYGEWSGKAGDKLTQLSGLLIIILSAALFVSGRRRIVMIRSGAVILFGLAGLLLCSTLWSLSPALSFRQNLLFISGVIGAIGIVETCDGDEIMDLIARICFLAAAASLVLMVVDPSTALEEGGELRGVFSQKNTLGVGMTIGALATLHRWRSQEGRKLSSIVFLVTIIAATLESRSSTSFVVIAVFIVMDVMIRLIQKEGNYRSVGVVGISVVTVFLVIAIPFRDDVIQFLGKDPTLTGRTDIWAMAIPNIDDKLFFGWGYMAFWSSDNPVALAISDAVGWRVPHAHNGILEIMLNVGLVGTTCFVLVWLRNLWLSLRCMRRSDKNMGASCLLSWIGILIVSLTEVVLVYPGPSTLVFFVTGLFCERADYIYRRSRRLAVEPSCPPLCPRVTDGEPLPPLVARSPGRLMRG